MIQAFVDRFMANRGNLEKIFAATHPGEYKDIVRVVVNILATDDEDGPGPDPERIHEIDDGGYQGTLLFVIGEKGYQPSTYWAVTVDYGSCSGCDTLEGIRDYSVDPPSSEQVKDYMTLALHIVQGLKVIEIEEEK